MQAGEKTTNNILSKIQKNLEKNTQVASLRQWWELFNAGYYHIDMRLLG